MINIPLSTFIYRYPRTVWIFRQITEVPNQIHNILGLSFNNFMKNNEFSDKSVISIDEVYKKERLKEM